ncbi:hypothetical protein CFBP3846_03409 [Pseudomonas syringae pv. avii]|uniref:Uncharacterized protein n=2 Tax=Pseudomonas syringae group TaxID=136849 RepID=A0ABY1UBW9_PSESX|nr:hypothetical protein CFBP1573P_01186 [Pseudomonas syringae pv. persicae]SOQ11508.1 hypothetical protein NCPPB2254_03350 [Pseudomonas syringae pv. persicae]SOS27818.1 hypothetical protein CFBP3846_03409 [Pseudomonas syringae pv. avii]
MIDGQSLGKLVATAAGLRIVRKPGVWKGSRSAKALRCAAPGAGLQQMCVKLVYTGSNN